MRAAFAKSDSRRNRICVITWRSRTVLEKSKSSSVTFARESLVISHISTDTLDKFMANDVKQDNLCNFLCQTLNNYSTCTGHHEFVSVSKLQLYFSLVHFVRVRKFIIKVLKL